LLVRKVICLQALLFTIVSNPGQELALTSLAKPCDHLRIDHTMLTAVHVQTDCQAERMNTCMEQCLLELVNQKQDNWVKWLPLARFAADNGKSESTKCSLFLAVLGVDPHMSFAQEPIKEQVQ
jgi:hypothetical protein